jgi:hypothetical protein
MTPLSDIAAMAVDLGDPMLSATFRQHRASAPDAPRVEPPSLYVSVCSECGRDFNSEDIISHERECQGATVLATSAPDGLRAFAQRRADFHATYNGGWHGNADGMRAFHHGMDTVFNALEEAAALRVGVPDEPPTRPNDESSRRIWLQDKPADKDFDI